MRWGIWIVMVALFLGGYAIKQFVFPTYTHSYRLTVEAEFRGQPVNGSGIVTVKTQDNGPLAGIDSGIRFHVSASGQSPVLDLGDKGLLVAVLMPQPFPGNYKPRPASAKDISFRAYFGMRGGTAEFEHEAATIRQQRGLRKLDENNYPGLVWVRDPKNNESADAVMPGDLDKVIDPSLHIKEITVEITDDRNTNDIFEKLPWLEGLRNEEEKYGALTRTGTYSPTSTQFLGDDQ